MHCLVFRWDILDLLHHFIFDTMPFQLDAFLFILGPDDLSVRGSEVLNSSTIV